MSISNHNQGFDQAYNLIYTTWNKSEESRERIRNALAAYESEHQVIASKSKEDGVNVKSLKAKAISNLTKSIWGDGPNIAVRIYLIRITEKEKIAPGVKSRVFDVFTRIMQSEFKTHSEAEQCPTLIAARETLAEKEKEYRESLKLSRSFAIDKPFVYLDHDDEQQSITFDVGKIKKNLQALDATSEEKNTIKKLIRLISIMESERDSYTRIRFSEGFNFQITSLANKFDEHDENTAKFLTLLTEFDGFRHRHDNCQSGCKDRLEKAQAKLFRLDPSFAYEPLLPLEQLTARLLLESALEPLDEGSQAEQLIRSAVPPPSVVAPQIQQPERSAQQPLIPATSPVVEQPARVVAAPPSPIAPSVVAPQIQQSAESVQQSSSASPVAKPSGRTAVTPPPPPAIAAPQTPQSARSAQQLPAKEKDKSKSGYWSQFLSTFSSFWKWISSPFRKIISLIFS